MLKRKKGKEAIHMAAKTNRTEGKKSFKEKFHDYCMGLSKIAPFGLNDKEDKYYHSIYNFDK